MALNPGMSSAGTAEGASAVIDAVGDISFQGRYADTPSPYPFAGAAEHFSAGDSIVVGNLENPLVDQGTPVPGKCSLRGQVAWARVLADVGFHMLSLANNHIMDYGFEGLNSTMTALREQGIFFVGAGMNRSEACAPAIVTTNGVRVAFLGRSTVVVSSHCYAAENCPGVARFDLQETIDSLAICRAQADYVVLLMHWGLEQYHYPSPRQRELARILLGYGANAILGHHPHVLQGSETVCNGLVNYSLGNFLFDNFEWTAIAEGGCESHRTVALLPDNRCAGILRLHLAGGHTVLHSFHPTRILADYRVVLDTSAGSQLIYAKLCSRLRISMYNVYWHVYSIHTELRRRILPMLRTRLSWRRLRKLRPRHFLEFARALRRSARISSQRSTNPYE